MGISGLLPQLKSITRKAHVSKYRGQTVAVDAYCLLHRGAYCCPRELVEGEPTDRHVQYCMARIELMASAGVRPLVVFDGGRLPNKQDEERTRERNREENKARARALWAQGNKAAAMECYQRAVDVSPAHAKQFVEALKRRGIAFIVAPYEADAQMAYLALNGLVDAVITEDSDLLCYGCPTVFFKMDKCGEGEEVQLQDLPQARELSFQGFGHDLFQEMCVLAGCDFVASLPGIGIKKAHQHLRRTRCFLKVVRALRFDGTKIPEGYEQRVQRALWTFKHQRVYCPQRKATVYLREVVGGDLAAGARVPAAAQLVDGEPDFLGPALPDDVAQAIALGDLDPITQQPFGDDLLQPCTAPLLADAAAGSSQPVAGARQAAAFVQPGPARQQQQQQQQQQHKSVRGKSGKAVGPGAGNGGNTLTNYKGFLRGLSKPASSADFRAPWASSSLSGSQDSSEGQQQQQQQPPPPQQQRGQEQPAIAAAAQEQQQEQAGAQGSLPASPLVARKRPAGELADTLASPTTEQWERFRQLRKKGSGRAPPEPEQAAAVGGGSLPVAAARLADMPAASATATGAATTTNTTSKYFQQQPTLAAGVRKPAGAPRGGGLVARLKAALQQDEPSLDDLLSERKVAEPGVGDASDDENEVEACGNKHAQQQQQQGMGGQGGRARRFSVPYARGQPNTPLDLGLRSSPTINDLLGSRDEAVAAAAAAAAADMQHQMEGETEDEEILVPGSVGAEVEEAEARLSLRLWMPQRVAPQQQQELPQRLDLISPGGPALFLQQQAGMGGVTPGFYTGGSEAGSDVRLTSLPRRPPQATPASASPLRNHHQQRQQQQYAASRDNGSADALASHAAAELDAGLNPSPYDANPIASLRHIAAFQPEAEAAVERAAQAAVASAAGARLRRLPEKENRLLAAQQQQQQPGSKRQKSGAVGLGTAAGQNPFAAFACSGR